MIYGYARISDRTQNINSQVDELKEFGVDKVVQEVVTGISPQKDKLDSLVEELTDGDQLVVVRHDRLGRNTLQLLTLIEKLEEKNVRFRILNLDLDTRGPLGKPILTILSAFSEMERSVLKEKQRKGIESAKRRGVHMGRKPKYTKDGLKLAVEMFHSNQYTVSQIEAATQVSRASLYRELKK